MSIVKQVLNLLCFLAFASAVHAAGADGTERLIRLADEQKLYEDAYWRTLLHYKKTLSGGSESFIDDPRFFLASDGKFNPKAELEADIIAFFSKEIVKRPRLKQTNPLYRFEISDEDDTQDMICRFPARYAWLREKLNIAESEFPQISCESFERVMENIKPKSVTLIFPTYSMNSPASMFGHTLLTIDTENKSKPLSQAINYAASTNETNGLFFAFKGIFGFYRGYYSVLPYYQKIQEYSDIRQRDIWEYPLNLSESEVRRMLMHLWELKDLYSYYYFFDENCSYNLLFLIESARPSLNLTEQFSLWILPIDTVKAVKKAGLTDTADYRPSKATRIKQKISHLSDAGQQLALDIIEEKITPQSLAEKEMAKDEKIRILDLTADYLQYQYYAKEEISKPQYQKLLLESLKIRSRLGKPEENSVKRVSNPFYDGSAKNSDAVPVPPLPDNVHESNRLGIGVGLGDDGVFQQIAYRPAFGDLSDTDYRQDQGIQIEFFPFELRYYDDENDFVLQSFDLIDIVSISPADRFFMPYSWKISTGLIRKKMRNDSWKEEDALFYRLNTGGGLAVYNDFFGLAYLFLEPELLLGGALSENYSLGIGLSAGLLRRMTSSWKCHLSGKSMYFGLGDTHSASNVSLSQHVQLTRNSSLSFDVSWEKDFDVSSAEAVFRWNFFF
ncbi:MAG: hypothetical protein BWK80_52270 [Desulfobacteraceae bacterium IS3]|nr:MAG: hypothetical protein BWK80_52270 [Desulfobacteraceae bacterium IS3]